MSRKMLAGLFGLAAAAVSIFPCACGADNTPQASCTALVEGAIIQVDTALGDFLRPRPECDRLERYKGFQTKPCAPHDRRKAALLGMLSVSILPAVKSGCDSTPDNGQRVHAWVSACLGDTEEAERQVSCMSLPSFNSPGISAAPR